MKHSRILFENVSGKLYILVSFISTLCQNCEIDVLKPKIFHKDVMRITFNVDEVREYARSSEKIENKHNLATLYKLLDKISILQIF